MNISRCLNQGIEPPRGNPERPDPSPSAETKPSKVEDDPKYEEMMRTIQRLMEGALTDMNSDNVKSARENLTKALNQLKLL